MRRASGPSRLSSSVKGATFVEYLIVVGTVALVALAGFRFFGGRLRAKTVSLSDCVATLTPCGAGTGAPASNDGAVPGEGISAGSDAPGGTQASTTARPTANPRAPRASQTATVTAAVQSTSDGASEFNDRAKKWLNGAISAFGSDMAFGLPGFRPKNATEYNGAAFGHIAATAAGLTEMLIGGSGAAGSGAVAVLSDGTLAPAAAPAAAWGIGLATAGLGHAATGIRNLGQMHMEGTPSEEGAPSAQPGEPAAGGGGTGTGTPTPEQDPLARFNAAIDRANSQFMTSNRARRAELAREVDDAYKALVDKELAATPDELAKLRTQVAKRAEIMNRSTTGAAPRKVDLGDTLDQVQKILQHVQKQTGYRPTGHDFDTLMNVAQDVKTLGTDPPTRIGDLVRQINQQLKGQVGSSTGTLRSALKKTTGWASLDAPGKRP